MNAAYFLSFCLRKGTRLQFPLLLVLLQLCSNFMVLYQLFMGLGIAPRYCVCSKLCLCLLLNELFSQHGCQLHPCIPIAPMPETLLVNACQITVEPRYFEVPREMEKKFEIAGFRNNRGNVKFVRVNNLLIKYSTL